LERAAAGEGNGVLLLLGVAADAAAGLGEIFAPLRIALREGAAERAAEHKSEEQPIRGLGRPDHAAKHNKRPGKRKPRRSGAFGAKRFLVLLLAEILMAGAAGLADGADRRLDGRLVAASAHRDEPLHRVLEVVLGRLELGRLAPDRRQCGGLDGRALGALGEAVPGHPERASRKAELSATVSAL